MPYTPAKLGFTVGANLQTLTYTGSGTVTATKEGSVISIWLDGQLIFESEISATVVASEVLTFTIPVPFALANPHGPGQPGAATSA